MAAWQSSQGFGPPMTWNDSTPASAMRNRDPVRIVSASVVRATISL